MKYRVEETSQYLQRAREYPKFSVVHDEPTVRVITDAYAEDEATAQTLADALNKTAT